MPARKSIAGRRFTRLIVLSDDELVVSVNGSRNRIAQCLCDCGVTVDVRYGDLTIGRTKSCGCLHIDTNKSLFTSHGQTVGKEVTRTYAAWGSMKARCGKNYTGRGITVFPPWAESFERFVADAGWCPEGMTIDRWPNKVGNYEPGNVRWATMLQQNRNRTDNRILTVRGITACLSELAEHFGVNQHRVWARLNLGWPVDAAVFAPYGTRTSKVCCRT